MLADLDPAHITVLRDEAIDALVTDPRGVYVDLTFGRGGHSLALLSRLAPEGRLLALDRDPEAAQSARRFQDPRFEFHRAAFSSVRSVLADRGIRSVTGLLADLGVSSPQIDQADRGFSFMRDGPLDMRMDPTVGPTAAQWLAQVGAEELEEVIRDYGDERNAGPIARAIVSRCQQAADGQADPLVRTSQLAELVAKTVRRRSSADAGQHPATRTFQAIRIRINQEVGELDALLEAAPGLLTPGGRIGIISFHSLEDRRVKQAFRQAGESSPSRPRGMGRGQWALLAAAASAGPRTAPPVWRELAKIKPSRPASLENPRARSAVLRVAERLGGPSSPAEAQS